ncbi:unnamed protein product [Closterium sp. NIES-64]|nr:unnamed protein product [Closterium sp. NIES-64]
MVGSSGHRTIVGVFRWIMQKEGWRGLFRGNAINVIRVAPGKAVELFTYDTVKKLLTPPDGGKPIIPIPPSSIAGSAAGVAACCLMYPLELVKTRLTIQVSFLVLIMLYSALVAICAGVAACCLMYPLELVKTRLTIQLISFELRASCQVWSAADVAACCLRYPLEPVTPRRGSPSRLAPSYSSSQSNSLEHQNGANPCRYTCFPFLLSLSAPPTPPHTSPRRPLRLPPSSPPSPFLSEQPGEYRSILHAFYRIITEEGTLELHRRLGPILIGTVLRALNVSRPCRCATPLCLLSLSSPPPSTQPPTTPLPFLSIQPGEYRSILHAFYRIITEEGAHELYRGLGPSLIGIVPYAGSNYFAYDTLRTLYKRLAKKDKIEPLATLIIGSLAGAAAASATFPWKSPANRCMQVGALKGRVVYKGTLDCIQRIVQEQGIQGLYRGLVPSCVKLMPAAGISFMCYEALKHVFVEDDKVTAAKPGGA